MQASMDTYRLWVKQQLLNIFTVHNQQLTCNASATHQWLEMWMSMLWCQGWGTHSHWWLYRCTPLHQTAALLRGWGWTVWGCPIYQVTLHLRLWWPFYQWCSVEQCHCVARQHQVKEYHRLHMLAQVEEWTQAMAISLHGSTLDLLLHSQCS